ncbi:LOW QUALITY PROTEIN: UBN2_3 domain-containing protein, partial [Cephalotus follicularis]
IDFNDPLYLLPSDTPSTILVTEHLTGNENYGEWSRAMTIALRAKNRRRFIHGSFKNPVEDSVLLHQWERCNAIVLPWIINTVSKKLFISMYYTKLRQLWDEYASLATLASCACQTSRAYLEHDQQQKLLFFMGLNDSYGGIRSQILMMTPLPIVGQAYSLINQEESHRGIIAGTNNHIDMPAMFYSNSNNYK